MSNDKAESFIELYEMITNDNASDKPLFVRASEITAIEDGTIFGKTRCSTVHFKSLPPKNVIGTPKIILDKISSTRGR